MDPLAARSRISSSGVESLRPFLSLADQAALTEATFPTDIHRHSQWKQSLWYQERLLWCQLDERTDNGSRREAFLVEYCKPILNILARAKTILQPGCGCGRWLSFLRRSSSASFIGFDTSELLLEHATRSYQDRTATFVRANMLSFPAFAPVDLILLDYEFLNAFNLAEARVIVNWAHKTLREGGFLFGDLRPPSNPTTRKTTIVTRDRLRIVWRERGHIGNGFFGSQSLVFDTCPLHIRHQCQDLISLFGDENQAYVFQFPLWRQVNIDIIDHIPTDKRQSKRNVRFLLGK
jgi:hypothetical protein